MRICVGIVVLLALAGAAGAQQQTLDEFERKVVAELAAKDPQAPALFRQATQARDHNDLATASTLFERVEKLVPSSSHAFRRHAMVEMMQHHGDSARRL